ncbi:MAG: 4Fe-4S ferredoxin, partial [Deltaproteobacteria bacterium]|nr:4Fe-4S ferredoxin [Deltaproteobacteria bacterium]
MARSGHACLQPMSPTGLHASAVASSLLTAGLLVPVQLLVRPPMLLAERFVPGLGWAEVGLLAIYAGWMTSRILRPREGIRWRQRLWRLFSLVFFLQLALGLGGVAECLMSGQLHLPVPALIVAGPVFRGEGLFMPILLGSTLLLTGPGWCSHLCYIGAWDDLCAVSGPRRPRPLPAWRNLARLCILGGVLAVAVLLRAADAPAALAGVLAGLFGVAGVGVMVLSSRHSGAMVHCASWCPIGWLTTTLGRLSPFRVRLDRGCVG